MLFCFAAQATADLWRTCGQVGVGMTMEAIEQNPVVYELMSEMGWRSEAFDIAEWVQRYAERRYALATGSSPVGEAWELLREATYNQSVLDYGWFGFTPGTTTCQLTAPTANRNTSSLPAP